jgi:APA family basic amino acid/polyamine antiporter
LATESTAASLVRRLGPADAAAIVVSNVIGSGIFITPPIIAAMVHSPGGMLSVWLAGGLLAFAGAMAYAELAALRPHAGGEYIYLRDAFGPVVGFLTGWTSFVAGFSGAVAASAVGLAYYLGRFIPAAADRTPLVVLASIGNISLVVSPQAIVALTAIAALTVIHVIGLGPGRVVQNVLAGAKVSALVVFVALGFTLGGSSPDHAGGSTAHFSGGGVPNWSGWLLALIPVMFSYSGWNAAAYVAEEVRDPGRNVPRALAAGTAAVVVIYLSLNFLYLYAMPIDEIAALKRGIVDTTAERLFGFEVAGLLAAFTVVSIAASISAMVLAGPRVYYAMAQDGLFFRAAGQVHPRFRTPAVAIIAQSIWSALLVLSGTFEDLVEYTGFAVVLFAAVAVLALFRLRLRDPDIDRPFKAWGYPVAPGIFAAVSLLTVANAIWRTPRTAAFGLLVIGAGIPLYALAKINQRRGVRGI